MNIASTLANLNYFSQQDEAVLRASSDVTEALKRTSTLMQQELEKSTFSASMLGKKLIS